MALAAGARLGPYEVLALLGTGGMGEVYRARDTRLKRDVAIKVLPEAFAQDPERLARFQREAELLATLNHPNIAAVYGLEQAEDLTGIVLELVEGETLADLITRGPIAVRDALPIARQIADALEAAHEKGIIHRDLKPANIKVTVDGKVKVLDFGLAKLAMPERSGAGAVAGFSQSPTITSPAMMTGAGVILGTAAYMAPEQARGKGVDQRADLWAFGCVLYEMLAGRRAFGGYEVSDTLAAIILKEPEWTALPSDVPGSIRRLLHRCLEKEPKERLHDIADARIEIRDALAAPSTDLSVVSPIGVPRSAWGRGLPWAVAGAAVVGLGAMLALWAPWRKVPPPTPLRLEATLGADASLVTDQGAAAVLSPDGSVLAFVAQKTGIRSQLYVRRLDQLRATPLAGTDDARDPFFSPDGQWIAFFAGGKLKKMSVTGGAAVTVCDAPIGRGGAWSEDGTIAFTPVNVAGGAVVRVSSAGGTPEPVTTLVPGEATHRWPQVLRGGAALLYTANSTATGNYESATLVMQRLPKGDRTIVQRGAYYGRYLPSGHLVYLHGGTLFAAPFDLDRLEVTGQPVPVVEGVTANNTGGAQFAVSATGTLVYLPGQSGSDDTVPISWLDRAGKTTPLRATPANWSNPRFAPDGRRLAVDIFDGQHTDVWVYDWARDTLSRLTFGPGESGMPVWTPDGRRIVFRSNRADPVFNLYWQRADGTGEVQRLTTSKNSHSPESWHPSGKFLSFVEINPNFDLMILPMEGDDASGWKPEQPTVFLKSPFAELGSMFSPDGRWLAYASDETGRFEVYVRPFPGPGGKWQISTGAGPLSVAGSTSTDPRWSRTRHELFYGTVTGQIMVVAYTVEGESFHAEKPRLWSEGRLALRPRQRVYDLHPDGERFAVGAAPAIEGAAKQDKVVLIFNFFDELRRVAPVTKR